MNLNISERLIWSLRGLSRSTGAGFNLQEVIPPALEAAARSGRRTRGAGVRQVEGLGPKRFVLSADDDNDNNLRSRCE
jgi:hypothetical protein